MVNVPDVSSIPFADLSRRIAAVIACFGVMVPILVCVYVFGFPELLAQHPWVAALRFPSTPVSGPWLGSIFLLFLLCSTPLLLALAAAYRLFREFVDGRVFTVSAAMYLRRMAGWVFVQAWMPALGRLGLSAALSAANESRAVVTGLGSDDLALMVFSLILLGIARVMSLAAAMAEDHAAIV
jgi:ABC-type transport system involved in multi-copper enzyme maturation permease subunit